MLSQNKNGEWNTHVIVCVFNLFMVYIVKLEQNLGQPNHRPNITDVIVVKLENLKTGFFISLYLVWIQVFFTSSMCECTPLTKRKYELLDFSKMKEKFFVEINNKKTTRMMKWFFFWNLFLMIMMVMVGYYY